MRNSFRCSTVAGIIVSTVWGVSIAHAQSERIVLHGSQKEPPPSTRLGPDRPRNMDHYMRGIDANFLGMQRFGDAPRREGTMRWLRMLGIPKSCELCIDERFNSLVTEHNAVLDQHAPDYVAASAAAGAIMQQGGADAPAELAGALANMGARSERIRAALERVELEFVDDLAKCIKAFQPTESAMDDAAIETLLEPMRLAAKRRYFRELQTVCRWALVDLRWVLETVPAEHLNDEVRAAIRPALLEYDVQLTPLIRQMGAAYQRMTAKSTEMHARLSVDLIDQPAFASEVRPTRIRLANAARAVRVLNERTLQTLAEVMPPAVAREFTINAKYRAFPELYPDPTSLVELFDGLRDDGEVTPEVRAELVQMRQSYDAECLAANTRLEAVCIESAERHTRGDDGGSRNQSGSFQELLIRRTEMDKRWAAAILGVVPEEVMQRYRGKIPEWPQEENR